MLFLDLYSACQVIHNWSEQNKPLRRSLNLLWKRVIQTCYAY